MPLLVDLLGALHVTVDGRELELGAPRQQALFAQVATRCDQVVSRTELIDGIWGAQPPSSVRGSVYTYVSQLRQALAGDRKVATKESALMSVGSGYRLRVDPENVDSRRFENAFRQAAESLAGGDVEAAIESWDEGLGLWRGEPLAGLPGPFAESERARLSALRLAAIEDRAEALLGLDRESSAGLDLSGVVAENPLRERLRALHMIALYRGGRQADALEQHEQFRRMLADELGVDPGAEVQEAYQRILVGDPALAGPATDRVARVAGRRAVPASERSPYPGLLSFSAGNAQYFFGRQRLTTTLVDRLGDPSGGGPIAVIGASGSGKSSLLRAGLASAIDGMDLATPRRWSWLLITPGSKPVEALASALAQATGRPQTEILGYLQDRPAELAALPATGDRPVVMVDQFEELFTLCEKESERRAFVRALSAVSTPAEDVPVPPVSVVLAVRADFYGHCAQHPELVGSLERALVVGPMTGESLREAIEAPAELAGLELEPGLADLVLRDLSAEEDAGGALPLLAHALLAIWQDRDGTRLTLRAYAEVGGVHQAIATTADTTYARFDPFGREMVRRMLLRMVYVGEGVEPTRRRVDRVGLIEGSGDPATAAAVLDALARARLVVLDEDTAEISHEALLRSWPRLRQWIADDSEGLRLHQQLTQDAAAWQREGKDESALYRGTRLAIAKEWADALPDDRALAPVERELLAASVAREDRERQAAAHRTRRLRRLVAGLTVLLVVAVTSTVIALTERSTAVRERADATSRQVALRADSLQAADPALAAQLSLAAYRISPTTQARGSLLTTSGVPPATRLLGHTGGVAALSFSGNGKLLASAGKDKTVRVWDGRTRTELATVRTASDAYGVALSKDGGLMAAGTAGGTVLLWDMRDPRHPAQLAAGRGHTDTAVAVAFSPDGRKLVSAAADKTLRLWDVAGRQLRSPRVLAGHEKAVTSVAFSPDGRLIASGGYDTSVRLWNAADGTPAGVLAGHTNAVTGVAFSPVGHLLASAGYDETVRLWDTTSRSPVASLTGATSFLEAVAFSPDGRTVAAGGDDHNTLLWDVDARLKVATFAAPSTIRAVAFSPDGSGIATGAANWAVTLWDVRAAEVNGRATSGWSMAFTESGRMLASGHYDGTVHLWNMADSRHPREVAALPPHGDAVTSVTFSPDGRLLADASYDHTVRLWDVSDPRRPVELSTVDASDGQLESVAFSPDGRTLASAGDDHLIRLWDVSDPRHVRSAGPPLAEHTDVVSSVVFGRDGKTLASGSYDGTARLWDVSDPRHVVPGAKLSTGQSAPIRGIALARDGHTLATAGDDHAVRLWDVSATPVLLSSLTDHTNTVTSVALSPDGKRLASASWDRTVSTWDISDPREPTMSASLSGPAGNVTAVAFNPGDGSVAAGVADAPNVVWQNDPESVADQICATRGTPISPAEWETYVGDGSLVDPCAGP
ncbi:nSTAND1 domain-containing NTPase [Amycolatopsis jiangsuensis]|uniref:WD40 repeat protein/DNA-binding SARP family transcriptional activator n=1 Tax=Amycolatopsis jiangsuensis TaxID=1181879 RepID=A0A840IRM5_9PSEU|nr:BTAD domain-containing putative transcriptional regulator [Amycolatopsis jiangsuensis]MBB4683818.1 WD40 repeat protein/DNA-binding SARP family transcriptional activator [Amycolatopsis jiangsuensis]